MGIPFFPPPSILHNAGSAQVVLQLSTNRLRLTSATPKRVFTLGRILYFAGLGMIPPHQRQNKFNVQNRP